MKIIIRKDDLQYAVSAVEHAISSKNTMPTLGGVSIRVKDGALIFRATDMEMAMQCAVPAQCEGDGEAIVPGRRFSSIVKLLPAGEVTLTTVEAANDAGQSLRVSYAGSNLTLPCFPNDEFPLLPQPTGELSGSIGAPAFRRMIKQVVIGAAMDEVRPVFTGVMTEIEGSAVTMVATDTHRLTRVRGSWEGNAEARLLIPARTMVEVARLAAADDQSIRIDAARNQVFFSFGSMMISTRLIMGQYPDYRQVIPEDRMYLTAALAERASLISSLERAQLVAGAINRSKGNLVRLELNPDELYVAAEAADEGMIREPLPLELQGEPLQVNYNARYLLDVLRTIEDDKVLFRLTGANTPGLILPASGDDEFLYLLLPVRVSK